MKTRVAKRLFEEHGDDIYHFLLSISRSEALAGDLLQDTFLQVLKYYKVDIKNERAWLFKIAINLFKKKKLKQAKFDEVEFNEEYHNYSDEGTSNEQIDWKILSENIVNKLSEENNILAEIYILKVDSQLTHKEISRALDVPTATLSRHLNKIKSIILNNFSEDLINKLF